MEYRWASAPFALGGLCGCGVIFLWYATCGILSLGEQVMLSPNPFCDPYTQGAMALQQRDFDTAMPWLNRAIAVNPNDADAYASRGDVY